MLERRSPWKAAGPIGGRSFDEESHGRFIALMHDRGEMAPEIASREQDSSHCSHVKVKSLRGTDMTVAVEGKNRS